MVWFWISQIVVNKGQIKPKADWCAVDSPKKRKNEFVFSYSEKQKSKKIHSFVHSLGESAAHKSAARKSAYGLIWPLQIEETLELDIDSLL